MFLQGTSFSYNSGTASGSNGWSYSIRARFDSQLASQPQYRTIADGWRYIANMAIGLADDDYRSKFGVMPGTNQSEFGQWINSNQQAVYNDAQGWFAAAPVGTTLPPTGGTTTLPPNTGAGTSTSPFPQGSTTEGGFFSSLGTMGIVGAIALAALLLLKR